MFVSSHGSVFLIGRVELALAFLSSPTGSAFTLGALRPFTFYVINYMIGFKAIMLLRVPFFFYAPCFDLCFSIIGVFFIPFNLFCWIISRNFLGFYFNGYSGL